MTVSLKKLNLRGRVNTILLNTIFMEFLENYIISDSRSDVREDELHKETKGCHMTIK